VAVFPEASVTTKVLLVVPGGNSLPEAKPEVWLIEEPEQLSSKTGAV
jgi:hypothetical protein